MLSRIHGATYGTISAEPILRRWTSESRKRAGMETTRIKMNGNKSKLKNPIFMCGFRHRSSSIFGSQIRCANRTVQRLEFKSGSFLCVTLHFANTFNSQISNNDTNNRQSSAKSSFKPNHLIWISFISSKIVYVRWEIFHQSNHQKWR